MPDLTPENVKVLANSIGLDIQETELLEITHRLNVIMAGVEGFEYPNLENFEPTPFPSLEEGVDGQ
ncbi:MAG: hypothetical protein DK304_000299 [Chloroflexi bacterium]|jgi:hypothetical protein|nr:MAG: hypothetical protein DK304_000299 [Chloroflexota bacterium]